MSRLPLNWEEAPLGDLLTEILGGGTPDKSKAEFFLGDIPFMTVKDMRSRFIDDTQDHISQEALASSASRVVPADTLVIASRMSLGKIARPTRAVAINQDLKALFLREGVSKSYIEYAWRANAGRIQAMGTGTTVKGIRLEDIRGLVLPVAPTAEQTRIADQLDILLARIRACQDRLEAIPAFLKRFRKLVLSYALSGQLTEAWRGEQGIGLESWSARTIADVAEVGTGSTPLRSNSNYYAATGTPWVTSAATGRSYIDSADQYVTKAAIAAHRLKVYRPGTLIVAMYGEGRTRGQVAELRIDATINQACAAITVDQQQANAAFVKLVLLSQYEQTRALAEGGAQPNLNLSKVRGIALHLPLGPEQVEIVRRVGELFAFADSVESRVAAAAGRTRKLPSLTLSKAFRGELVPQDPNDEPASALLARIAAQRGATADATSAPTPRGRPPRAPKESATMTKSRQDHDVIGQPYLAGHLRRLGAPATAETLFKAAELPVADFYKQLSWEVAQGHVKDNQTTLEPGHAAG